MNIIQSFKNLLDMDRLTKSYLTNHQEYIRRPELHGLTPQDALGVERGPFYALEHPLTEQQIDEAIAATPKQTPSERREGNIALSVFFVLVLGYIGFFIFGLLQ